MMKEEQLDQEVERYRAIISQGLEDEPNMAVDSAGFTREILSLLDAVTSAEELREALDAYEEGLRGLIKESARVHKALWVELEKRGKKMPERRKVVRRMVRGMVRSFLVRADLN